MDKKTAETLAQVLSEMNCIPSFDGALLFSDDVADVVGFQIKCSLNNTGRMVYSLRTNEDQPEAITRFMTDYERIHGNPIRTNSSHDSYTSPHYPTMGTDYMYDLAPATIVRILRVAFENSNELVGVLPAYIMRLTREVQKWHDHFAQLTKKATGLSHKLEQVLEESF